MNEKLEERLMSYLDSIAKQAETTSDFLGDQVPLVVQEYIQFHFYGNLISLAFFTLMIVMFSATFFLCRKKENDCDPFPFVGKIISFLVVLGSILGVFECVTELAKNVTAPRIVVLEKVADLVKEKV